MNNDIGIFEQSAVAVEDICDARTGRACAHKGEVVINTEFFDIDLFPEIDHSQELSLV